jgi:protein-S-isoprenylcysteine O-methyltransferase Ste14
MLNHGVLILVLINFGYIAVLPRRFFKQDAKLGWHFWITAAPLFASPAFLALAHMGIVPPLVTTDEPWADFMALIGVIVSTLSILLLGMAIGTHRVPLHMFHDRADSSVSHLVTYGPYRYIRHPIYSSYLFALCAAVLICPSIGTIACFVYGLVMLNGTAKKEEIRLCEDDELGPEYRDYMKESGRFLPPPAAMRLTTQSKKAVSGAADSSVKTNADAEPERMKK